MTTSLHGVSVGYTSMENGNMETWINQKVIQVMKIKQTINFNERYAIISSSNSKLQKHNFIGYFDETSACFILRIYVLSTSCEIGPSWIPQNLIDDKSTLDQQYWPWYIYIYIYIYIYTYIYIYIYIHMPTYGVTNPQWFYGLTKHITSKYPNHGMVI